MILKPIFKRPSRRLTTRLIKKAMAALGWIDPQALNGHDRQATLQAPERAVMPRPKGYRG